MFASLSAQKFPFPAKAAEVGVVRVALEKHGFNSFEDLNGADDTLVDGDTQLAGRVRALAKSIIGHASGSARSHLVCVRYPSML